MQFHPILIQSIANYLLIANGKLMSINHNENGFFFLFSFIWIQFAGSYCITCSPMSHTKMTVAVLMKGIPLNNAIFLISIWWMNFSHFIQKTDISHQILSKINLQHVVGRWIAHICNFSSWKLTSLTLFVFDGWPFFETSSSLFFHLFALRRNSRFGLTKISREFS